MSLTARRRRSSRSNASSFSFLVSTDVFVILLLLFGYCLCTLGIVDAIKPIRNLQVTFRGQSYTIRDGVNTVDELTKRFEQLSGMTELKEPRIVWKGKILKPGEPLSEAGIRPGDKVLVLPGERQAKGLDVLAMYIFLLSNNEEALEKLASAMQNEQSETIEKLQETLSSIGEEFQTLTRKDVADNLRNAFDLAYHGLRAWWEHPSFRQGLHDPDRIETYRKVVSTNLSPKVLEKSPTRLKEAIKSKENWRKEFLRISSNIIRVGDTILDGVLDLLLDILKGKGSNRFATQQGSSANSGFGTFSSTTATSDSVFSDPRMEDPSLANNLLYELSESEEEEESEQE
mmetsp:Transcript_27171/g.48259  ORF Transcript_27171/g.48259 Transcript_27171/m.48259 type:complete len:344 (-) Transcript_27171:241-1272(-)